MSQTTKTKNPFRTYPKSMSFLDKLSDNRPSNAQVDYAQKNFETALPYAHGKYDYGDGENFSKALAKISDDALELAVRADKALWRYARACYATNLYLARRDGGNLHRLSVEDYRVERAMHRALHAEVERRVAAYKLAARKLAKAVR